MKLIHIDTRDFKVFSLSSVSGKFVKHSKEIDMRINGYNGFNTITSLINPKYIQGLNLVQNNEGLYYIVMLMSGNGISDVFFTVAESFLNKILDDASSKNEKVYEKYEILVKRSSGFRTNPIPKDLKTIYSKSKDKVHSIFIDKFNRALRNEDENIILAELFKSSFDEWLNKEMWNRRK